MERVHNSRTLDILDPTKLESNKAIKTIFKQSKQYFQYLKVGGKYKLSRKFRFAVYIHSFYKLCNSMISE